MTSLQYFLQYPKKDIRDEAGFFAADKHQNFLQGDTIIFDGHNQATQKFAK